MYMPVITHAEKTKFELKKTVTKEEKKNEEKPLFDLLNSNSPELNTLNKSDNKNKRGLLISKKI